MGIGFYHTGVEINGQEYSYGGNFNHSGTGVFSQTPLSVEGAHYKESFLMGTIRDQQKIQNIIEMVKQEFKANQYNLITQNCNHFSEALILQLVGKKIPSYINRASRIGYFTSCFLPKIIKNQNPVPNQQQQDFNYNESRQPQNLPFSNDIDSNLDSSRIPFQGRGYRISDFETEGV